MNMSRLFCIILLAAASLSASPVFDITYNNGSAGNDGRYIIGLTQITLKDNAGHVQTFDSMCFDFLHEIGSGQQYNGTVTKLTDYGDQQTQALYDLAGFAYFGMHNLPEIPGVTPWEVLQGLQYGVWDLMDQNESDDNNIYGNYAYKAQVDAAVFAASVYPAGLAETLKGQLPHALDNLYVVEGVGNDSHFQKFIIGGDVVGVTASAVPEPGSMCLLGGGLFGLAMLLRKRAIR
jgi:hypothetical protein